VSFCESLSAQRYAEGTLLYPLNTSLFSQVRVEISIISHASADIEDIIDGEATTA